MIIQMLIHTNRRLSACAVRSQLKSVQVRQVLEWMTVSVGESRIGVNENEGFAISQKLCILFVGND